MCNLIVMTFDSSEDATQVYSVLRQLQENSQLAFDATVVTKDQEGKLHAFPINDSSIRLALPIQALEHFAADKVFVHNVLAALPSGSSALFMIVDEGDSNTTLITMLLLFAPSVTSLILPTTLQQIESTDAHFRAELESYHTAVANLEGLRSDSTEVDVEVVFKAVDDAYGRLVRFISAEPGAEDS